MLNIYLKICLVSFIIVAVLFPPFNLAYAQQLQFKTYSDPILGFSIKYPVNWSIGNGINMNIVNIESPTTPTKQHHELGESVVILVKDLNPTIQSLPQFIRDQLDGFRSRVGFKVIDSNTTTLSSIPAKKIVFVSCVDASSCFIRHGIFAITNNTGYMLLYTPYVSNDSGSFYFNESISIYKQRLPLIQQMVDSFQILP
jgi:hypothetical protein